MTVYLQGILHSITITKDCANVLLVAHTTVKNDAVVGTGKVDKNDTRFLNSIVKKVGYMVLMSIDEEGYINTCTVVEEKE